MKEQENSKTYIHVIHLSYYTNMIKSALAVTIGIVIVMSTAVTLIPIEDAEGHGVQAQLQSRFVRIQDEAFSAQNLQTGEEITVTGTLQSLVNRPLRAWISLFSESKRR